MRGGGSAGWDGIVSARMERMAAGDAARGEPAPAQRTESRHRFHRVLRTRGREAAPWSEQGADPALVRAQATDEEVVDHDACLRPVARVAAVVGAGYNS